MMSAQQFAVVLTFVLSGCADSSPDCSQYAANGRLSFHSLMPVVPDCPTVPTLNRVPPAAECSEGCTCILSDFRLHTEEADWYGGSNSYSCRSQFEQICSAAGTVLKCELTVGTTTQASAICRMTSEQKGPNWFCDYQAVLDFE